MITIKRAEISHLKKIRELETECFASPWSEEALAREIVSSNSLVLVAEQDERFLGFAMCMLMYDEIHITNIAVAESCRRTGIGDGLLRHMIKLCEDNGYNALTLEVRESNIAAIRLYESNGFVTEGVRKHYYEDNGENALIMWRHGGGGSECRCSQKQH